MISNIRFHVLAIVGLSFVTSLAMSEEKNQKKPRPARKPNPAFAPVEDVAGLPRVLLIGDSISIGYTIGVREALAGKANVHRPLTNCGPTTKGIAAIDQWLKTGGENKKWDVIHFNWGLHDLKYMGPKGQNLADPGSSDSHQQVPPAEYEKNLRQLAAKLKATGAKVIWRNTTPVPPGAKGRMVGDAEKYNKIAASIMEELGIPTHDLFTMAKENMSEHMLPANVHFTSAGKEAQSVDVAKVISETLAK